MIGLWLGAAAWAGIDVVAEQGRLMPGHPTALLVAVTEQSGQPAGELPDLQLRGAVAQSLEPLRPGVWRWVVAPSEDGATVEIRSPSGELERLPVGLPPPSSLTVPARTDATTDRRHVELRVRGPAALEPGDVRVVVRGGAVASIEPEGDDLLLTVAPDVRELPEVVAVGVWDRRDRSLPAWSRIHLRRRAVLQLTTEPAAEATLRVSERTYGPFVADARGVVEARVDQFPGESLARVRIVDELGNVTEADQLLGTAADTSLALLAEGPLVAGRPPPGLHLYGITAGGAPLRGVPSCRTPATDLAVVVSGPGTWLVALPWPDVAEDVRVACTLGGARVAERIAVRPSVPESLRLTVVPEDLRAGFPVAEVRVALLDARGDRLPPGGLVEVGADQGRVTLDPEGRDLLRGEYDGAEASQAGEDTLFARYVAPAGAGPVDHLTLAWGRVPSVSGGAFRVFARALDSLDRPLEGVPITLSTGSGAAAARVRQGTTDARGWMSADVRISEGVQPIRLEATSGVVDRRDLVLRRGPAAPPPGVDLEEEATVRIRPGRVAGIRVAVDPPLLYTGPGSQARVRVQLEDGAGRPVVDEPVELTVSFGRIGSLSDRPDGSLVADYVPTSVNSRREVEITAETESLRSTTQLVLEPRSVRVSLGVWFGAQTNLGAVQGPTGGVDLDFRPRVRGLGESVMLRLAAQVGAFGGTVSAGLAGPLEVRSILVPVSASLLLRDDRGPWALWAGGGGTAAVHQLSAVIAADRRSGTAVVPGLTAQAGVARRLLGGEVVLTTRFLWLPATSTGEIRYTGNVGGLAAGLGYRLVY